MRVLIVEDEALVALELEELLLDEGFEVVGSAANAAQAIDLGRRHRPAMALLDLNLADGRTGPRIPKTLVHERVVAVVFVTGQANCTTVRPAWSVRRHREPCVGRAIVKPYGSWSSTIWVVRRRRRLRRPCFVLHPRHSNDVSSAPVASHRERAAPISWDAIGNAWPGLELSRSVCLDSDSWLSAKRGSRFMTAPRIRRGPGATRRKGRSWARFFAGRWKFKVGRRKFTAGCA